MWVGPVTHNIKQVLYIHDRRLPVNNCQISQYDLHLESFQEKKKDDQLVTSTVKIKINERRKEVKIFKINQVKNLDEKGTIIKNKVKMKKVFSTTFIKY